MSRCTQWCWWAQRWSRDLRDSTNVGRLGVISTGCKRWDDACERRGWQAPGLCSVLSRADHQFKFSLRSHGQEAVCLAPASVAKQTLVVAHTYCFFCVCEARPLAFSLAASAVSLARSVAVSAKVLDGISPAKANEMGLNLLKIPTQC